LYKIVSTSSILLRDRTSKRAIDFHLFIQYIL